MASIQPAIGSRVPVGREFHGEVPGGQSGTSPVPSGEPVTGGSTVTADLGNGTVLGIKPNVAFGHQTPGSPKQPDAVIFCACAPSPKMKHPLCAASLHHGPLSR
jgi:hypothetical protein